MTKRRRRVFLVQTRAAAAAAAAATAPVLHVSSLGAPNWQFYTKNEILPHPASLSLQQLIERTDASPCLPLVFLPLPKIKLQSF